MSLKNNTISGYNIIGWSLRNKVNIDNISDIMAVYDVKVDADYHGCNIYHEMSLFTFITDIDLYLKLLHKITDFKSKTIKNNNILHETVMNPNPQCLYTLIDLLPDELVYELANEKNNSNNLPIELTNSQYIFARLYDYTEMTDEILSTCMNNSFTIKNLIIKEFNKEEHDLTEHLDKSYF